MPAHFVKRITSTRAGRTILAYVFLWAITMAAVWYVSVWISALRVR